MDWPYLTWFFSVFLWDLVTYTFSLLSLMYVSWKCNRVRMLLRDFSVYWTLSSSVSKHELVLIRSFFYQVRRPSWDRISRHSIEALGGLSFSLWQAKDTESGFLHRKRLPSMRGLWFSSVLTVSSWIVL